VVRTVFRENGVITRDRTFSWHGDDFSVHSITHVSPDPHVDKGGGNEESDAELRYIGGLFYEKDWYIAPPSGQWIHATAWDNGGSYEGFVPSEWLADSRSDLLGEGLKELVTSATGFVETAGADGELVYTGTLSIAELAEHELDMSGAALGGSVVRAQMTAAADDVKPKRAGDPGSTPVSIEVVVGADGLMRSATLSYEDPFKARTVQPGEQPITYAHQITYSQLGTAPAIEPPEPSQTITADIPEGFRAK
jgi:hypothetical protein